jgi:hypothetical protein
LSDGQNDYSHEHYSRMMDVRKTSLEMQGHYGKWLVSTLLLIHGAAIGFIANSDRLSRILIPDTLYIFVSGLVLALICGFITWLNWSFNFVLYETVDPDMRTDVKSWPDFTTHWAHKWVRITFFAPIVFGILSVVFLIWGAWHGADAIVAHDMAVSASKSVH